MRSRAKNAEHDYIANITKDRNTIIKTALMDTLDLILTALRYSPIALMGLSVIVLLHLQLKELRRP